jgi:hypothetical protein
MTAEQERLLADAKRTANWKRWGPYLSERQWATVREDYSPEGACWDYFPHDQARCRAYRWGEDGLLGITDRECRLCFALALWNGKDPILKERLFGLTGPEGNHGEDVKEQYFYLDSTPTHSYLKALYKYPQTEFPYARLIEENRRRSKVDPEFELTDTGVFDDHRYFDVFAEYAKYSPDDILIRLTVANRSSESATLHLLPTLWFRNTWTWKCAHEGVSIKPQIRYDREKPPRCLSRIAWEFLSGPRRMSRRQTAAGAITENETNAHRLWNFGTADAFVKDAFHEYIVRGRRNAASVNGAGTRAAAHYIVRVPAGAPQTVKLRLFAEKESPAQPLEGTFDQIFDTWRN